MLGIIGAMEEEVNEILALMNVEKEYQECNYHFYEGLLGKKEVVAEIAALTLPIPPWTTTTSFFPNKPS